MAKEWQMEDFKNCAVCGELKQIKEFAPNKVRGTYQYSRCRPCDQKKKHDWNKANYERQYENQKARLKENPEFYQEIKRKYKENNPEKIKELRKNWENKNSEYLRLKQSANQKIRKSGIAEHLLILQDNKCIYCQEEFQLSENLTRSNKSFSIDHLIPTLTQFTNSYDNICLCCVKCNSAKNHKTLNDFCGDEKAMLIKKTVTRNAKKIMSVINSYTSSFLEISEDINRQHFLPILKNGLNLQQIYYEKRFDLI